MRVPVYQSEGSVGAPQISTPKLPEPVKLDKLISGVERAYEGWEQERERAYKVFKVAERQRTQLSIDQKYAEIKDRIENGGSYADAEKEFQKFYDKTVKTSLDRFKSDPLSAQEISLDYNRSGMEYGLRIKNAVRDRTRKEAIDAFNNRVEGWKQDYVFSSSFEEKQSIISKFTTGMSSLESSGAIAKGSGQQKVRSFVADLKGLELAQIESELGPKDALAFLEREREVFPADYYVRTKIGLQDNIEALDVRAKALREYQEALSAGIPPKQEYVDVAFDEFMGAPENDTPEAVVSFVNLSGRVPSQFRNKASIYLSSDMSEASGEELQDAYNAALSVTEIQKNPAIKNLENAFSKDTEFTAKSIVDKVAAGVPVEKAVKDATKIASDPEYFSRYKEAKKDILKDLQGDVSSIRTQSGKIKGGISGPKDYDITAISDYADAYARKKAMFGSDEEARKLASEEISTTYDEYNGVTVKQPPHLMFPQYTKESWEGIGRSIQEKLRSSGRIAGTDRVVLMSGAATHAIVQKLRESGEAVTPDKVPFYVVSNNGQGAFRPVYEEVEIDGRKTMRPKVIFADPNVTLEKVYKYKSIKEGF